MKSLVYPFLSHSSHYLMFNNTFRFFLFDSLRKLVRILQRFRCFQRACVLGEAPHFSTFSRAAKWFREQGFPVFHAQLLQDLEVRYPQIVLIDSFEAVFTIHRQSGECPPDTTGLKDISSILCTTFERIILSHVLPQRIEMMRQ
jgi:hypothetical protein